MSRWRVQVSKSNDWHPPAVVALGVVLAAGVLGAFVGSTEGTARMVRGAAPPGLSAPARDAYGRLPMVFEANHGQADARVRYLARGSGYGLFLAPDEAVLVLDAPPGQTEGVAPAVADAPTIAPAVIRMSLAHASPRVGVYGVDPLPGKSHYFIGNDPREWITDVEHFARVVYRDVYPGVNLVFYGDQRNLEYDLVLSPGVDPSTVEIAFGADDPGDGPAAEVDAEGELLLHVGGVTIRHSPPRLYQDIAGTRRAVAGRYVLRGTDRVGFETGLYDTAHPLVIDPYIAFATYLGGKLDDEGSSVAVDMSGAIYVVGTTVSSDFPEVNPVRQRGGDQDVFVTKLDATGTTVLASTYLGGAGSDIGRGVTVDRMGENVYLTGATRSGDFPVASAVFQPAFRGGSDAFISRLKATGGELRYSTYLGGSGGSAGTNQDIGTAITLDAGGNAYVTGFTESPDFPTTSGAFDPAMGSRGDVFVAKVNPGGSSLVYATFLGGRDEGGSRDGADIGNAIAVDSAGSAYVTGETRSPLFPTTSNAIQATYGGGAFGGDAFLAQIDPAGSALSYSTFLGGGGDDVGHALDVAPGTGFAFVAGTSDSTDWEGTANAYQREPGGGSDAFVVWLSTTDRIPAFYRSFFGGSGADVARGIARDPGSVRIRIAGYTDSANLPTMSPLQSGYGGGAADGFVAEINPQVSGTPGLLFSTYLGRTGDDFIYGLDTDDAGALYLVGKTTSDTLASPGSYAHDRGGAADAFVARLGLGPTPTPTRTARSTTLAPTPSPTPTSTASPTVTPTMTPTPALTPTATSASRIVIDFEALEPDGPGRPPMVTVSGQYANLGATFNRPVALDYTKGNPLPGFTHSGTRAIELCYGQEFCTTPLEIVFAPPVQTVALWAGSRLPSAVERKVVMSAFAADGAFLSSAETVLPASTRPTPIQHPLEVGADGETIGRVSVTLTGAEAVLLNGLAVDDVAFVRASGVRPAPDTTAPRVIITEPRDGTVAVTEDGSFLLGGFVTDDTGVLDVAVTVAQPPGVGLRIATLQAYGPGPHYELGPTRTGPLFEHGPNIITVEVADFAGNVGAASVVVTAEDPPAPPPHPPVALDLFPEAIEVTQGVSYLRSIPPPPSPGASAGNVTGMAGFPFVAGKRTVVRLYGGMLEPWDSWQPDVEAVLHGIDANGWPLPGSPLHAVNGNVTVYRALDPSLHADAALRPYADRTWNFLLPTDWTGQGTIALVGEVNPYGSIEECAACFTDRNEVRLTDVTFRNTAELDLFPIWLTFPAGAPSLTADVETLYGLVPLLYPTARTNMRLLPGNRMTSSRDLTKDSGWDKLLDDVCDYYGANKSVVTALGAGHVPAFYGLVPGSVPRNGTVGIGRFGKPCAAGIAGPPDQDTAAHEIGHHLDMRHVQSDFDAGGNPLCGNIDKVNDSYPHYKDYLGRPLARASIGEVGFDTISMAARLPAAARSTAEYYDFMSYCEPAWISPYTWQYLFEVFSDRVGRTLAAPGSPRRTGPVFDLLASPRGARAVTGRGAPEDRARSDRVAPAQGPGGELVTYLLLRGEVTPDGAVSLDPPYRMEFDRAVEDAVAGSDGVVELSDSSNRVLVRRTFDLDVDADTARTGARFGVHVPWDDGATRVSVRVGQGTLLERRASRSAPEVTAVTPESAVWNADRPYRLTWQGADADGDTLRYAVQFSADNGLTWRTLALDLTATRIDVDAGSLPGTETARFRVVASDGFWSGYGETARSVSITAKAPRVQIVAPRDGSAVASGSVLVLEGLASDWEEGPLGDRALTWRSDVDGPLGVGRSVTVRNLSRGWHRVTVTATDAGGATATASVRIEVLAPRGRSVVSPARAYLPAAWRR